MTADALFLFGTLRHAPLYEAVSGAPLAGVEAWLPDHAVRHHVARGIVKDFPRIVSLPGAKAPGIVVRPDPEARARLDFYERIFDYVTKRVTVQTAEGPVDAEVYLDPHAGDDAIGPEWLLENWAPWRGALNTAAAVELMASRDVASTEQLAHRYGMLASHVSARMRAAGEAAPATTRRPATREDVSVERHQRPYSWFFGVEELDLRFRRFTGDLSEPVNRAGFVMADAVTVLPYDPVRDRVLLVEQFRTGPYLRGDQNPWTLECIAGRVDATETPEQAVRREAVEEAGLTLGALHKVANYYPSPGAVTEYLYTYVALAPLPDGAEGIHGLDSEAEDIRTHLVPFERLMAMIETGEVANGPLITSAYWLATQRDRFRAQASA